jgi:DNA polymerase III subunit epsilon
MREIVLDTETTGFDPLKGDRIVEIGCVELMNTLPTGNHLQLYINPERSMPAEAAAVHGLTDAFLKDKPIFSEVVGTFLDFIGDAPLVIHNASFDMKFLNAELIRLGFPALAMNRAIDTVEMARRLFPGSPASLDALCKRFNINSSARTYHGALLDSQLLAECYLEMRGGRQVGLDISVTSAARSRVVSLNRSYRAPRPHSPTDEELAAHQALIAKLKDPLWTKLA